VSPTKAKGGTFHGDIIVRGVRWHGSLRTRVKREASDREAALVTFLRWATDAQLAAFAARRLRASDVWAGQTTVYTPEAPHEWPTLREAGTRYTAWILANARMSDETHRHAKAHMEMIYDAFGGDVRLDAITTAQVEAWRTGDALAHLDAAWSRQQPMIRFRALYAWIQKQ